MVVADLSVLQEREGERERERERTKSGWVFIEPFVVCMVLLVESNWVVLFPFVRRIDYETHATPLSGPLG